MPVTMSATKTIDMIERLYGQRQTVSKDDAVAEARRSDLGDDGVKLVASIEPGDYTKEELTVAISTALIDRGGHGA